MPNDRSDRTLAAPGPGDHVVADLRERVLADMSRLLPTSDRWTAVDFPMHHNSGDSAIWLGELAIAAHCGARVERVLDRASFEASTLRDGDLVVIQGGGNWGGLYQSHHTLRLRVLHDLRNHPVVQMPQSIEYVDEDAREALRRAVDAHPDFTLLVRDTRSLEIAQHDYDCAVHLVPDAAFALGQLPRHAALVPVVRQQRTDKEAPVDQDATIPSFDWLSPEAGTASARWLRVAQAMNTLQRRLPGQALPRHATLAATQRLAWAGLHRATDLLARGDLVITDRLHGHVLCTLLRIPHVVVNDRFGKIEALWSTWTSGDPISRLSPSWAEAEETSRAMREKTP